MDVVLMVEMENLNARNFLRVLGMYADHVKERYMFAFEWSLFASFLLDVAIIFALHSTFINQPMCFSQTQLDEIGAGRSNWDVLAVEILPSSAAMSAPEIVHAKDSRPIHPESHRFLFARSKKDLFLSRHNHENHFESLEREAHERQQDYIKKTLFLRPNASDQLPQCSLDEDKPLPSFVQQNTVTLLVPNNYCMSIPMRLVASIIGRKQISIFLIQHLIQSDGFLDETLSSHFPMSDPQELWRHSSVAESDLTRPYYLLFFDILCFTGIFMLFYYCISIVVFRVLVDLQLFCVTASVQIPIAIMRQQQLFSFFFINVIQFMAFVFILSGLVHLLPDFIPTRMGACLLVLTWVSESFVIGFVRTTRSLADFRRFNFFGLYLFCFYCWRFPYGSAFYAYMALSTFVAWNIFRVLHRNEIPALRNREITFGNPRTFEFPRSHFLVRQIASDANGRGLLENVVGLIDGLVPSDSDDEYPSSDDGEYDDDDDEDDEDDDDDDDEDDDDDADYFADPNDRDEGSRAR